MDLPRDLPVVKRRAVRLAVVDGDGRILLFSIREPAQPDLGACWELPGGGINDDETYVDAAIRELYEETGILVQSGDIGTPSWRRRAAFRHGSVRRVQHEVVVRVQLHQPRPLVDEGGQAADEIETYEGYRWWSVFDIETSGECFYPARLPALISRFLAGEQIQEPFEFFS